MSKVDKIKEEIGWLKAIFGILVVTDISLVVVSLSSPLQLW